ncbi:MAG TPA: oligogalacturonate lyase family protein [Verrucomicrobiae bacterium]|jgi:oligogalacturonide lyase|nr:oligogalacturonate lyase family protein [Verrucomicrobiae bacterium]
MKILISIFALAGFIGFCSGAAITNNVPASWIDKDTGHRIARVSPEPDSASLYFHQNTYTPEGDKMIFDSPSGIAAVDLSTLGTGSPKVDIVVSNVSPIVMAWKSRDVYFRRDGILYAANVDTHAVREVFRGRAIAINCDETFSVTTITVSNPPPGILKPAPRVIPPQRERMFPGRTNLTTEEITSARKEDRLSQRLENPTCMAFVFTNLKTGQSTTNGYQYAWLNHLQFSPTDPNLLLYCHEGTWHETERIWTIRTDGSQQRLMHKRTMNMEIAGHEFWSHDGKTIWFDLQTPRSTEFWIAGVNLQTGKETRYKLQRDWWSVHYNVARDNKLFTGDGGDPGQVAFAKDGMWINLFRPRWFGGVKRERLVNLAKQDYYGSDGEPNSSITPDKKWVVFRSNMNGLIQVYAVEIAKTNLAK